jgi:hypothetical protein
MDCMMTRWGIGVVGVVVEMKALYTILWEDCSYDDNRHWYWAGLTTFAVMDECRHPSAK